MYNIRRLLILIFFLAIFSVDSGLWTLDCPAQEMGKEEESLFVAKKAFEDGFYEVSFGLLERFLKNYADSPRAAEARLLIGQCYFHQGKYFDALTEFESLLPQYAARGIRDAIEYWIAEVHFKVNNFAKAAEFYQKVTEDFPQSAYAASAYYSLGWCRFQEAKFDEALRWFSLVEERFSKEPLAQDSGLKVVECLYNLKDYGALKDRIKKYLLLYAKDPAKLAFLNFYLGEAEYYLNDFGSALEHYSRALSLKSEERIFALAKMGMGWANLKLKRYKEAKDLFAQVKPEALEKAGRDILLLGKAALLLETAVYDKAQEAYDELLSSARDPLIELQAYLGKADVLYNLGRYPEAIAVYKKSLEDAEGGMPSEMLDKLHYGLAWAYLKEGEFKSALEEFQKIALSSEDKVIKVAAFCQIGDTYQDSGDYQKAAQTYDTILKEYPDSFYGDYVQYQLGLVLLKSSKYEGAILAFKKLINSYPGSKLRDDAMYSLGLAYFQKEDYAASRDVFARFDSEFKESIFRPQAAYLLGTSLYNLGNFSESIEVFKDVVRQYSQDSELSQKAEYEIADCFYQLGDEKEAMSRFKALRAKYPDSSLTAEVIWWLGEYYCRARNFTLSRRYFSSIIQDFPKSGLIADAYYALGSIAEEEANYSEALNNFKKVIASGKKELAGTAAAAMGDVYLKLEQFPEALEAYKSAIAENAQLSGLIYPKIAATYSLMRNYPQALNYYRMGLELVPVVQMSAVQFKIAETLEAQGKQKEAIGEYLKVAYLYSEDNQMSVKSFLRVGAIYEDMANFKEAANIYGKVTAMNVEEAKFAAERIEALKQKTKQ